MAKLGAWLVAITLFALGPVAVLASTQITIVLGMTAFAGLLLRIARRGANSGFKPFARAWPWAIWLFLIYVVASDEWVPLYGYGLDRAWRVGISIILAVIAWQGIARLDVLEHRRAAIGLLAGLALAALLLLFERATGNALVSAIAGEDLERWTPLHNRGMSVLALFLPVILGLLMVTGHRKAALAGGCALVALVATSNAGAAIPALACAVLAWGLALFRPRLCAGLMTAAFALALFVLPAVPRHDVIMAPVVERAAHAPFSTQHRLVVLRFTADRIAERPWLGWGARSARDVPGGELTVADYAWSLDGAWPKLGVHESALIGLVMPLHPHNAFFQLRLELGLVGAGLFLLVLGAALWTASRQPRPVAAALMGIIASAASLWGLGFGLWQSWLIAALMLALAACAFLRRQA